MEVHGLGCTAVLQFFISTGLLSNNFPKFIERERNGRRRKKERERQGVEEEEESGEMR